MRTLHFLLARNSLEDVTLALGVAAGVFAILYFARNFVVYRLRMLSARTVAIWDDVLVDVTASTKLPFLVSLSILAGSTLIELPPAVDALPYKAMMVVLILQVGIWAAHAARTWVSKRVDVSSQSGDSEAITNFGVIAFVARIVIWVVVLLLLLDNLGVNITTLVASLGIGGIAVALALQNILGDLFASLSIAMDKPFMIGDFVVVDDLMGTVKQIGLKTTRIQSLSGEELVVSNNDLLKSRIRNYKRMSDRRAVFGFGVTFYTPPHTLMSLTEAVRNIIEDLEGTRFDRAHFKGFGASSLDFEVVYYVLSPDYTLFMDIQQKINLALLEYCNDNKIEFAFPTQTIHVASLAGDTLSAARADTTGQQRSPVML